MIDSKQALIRSVSSSVPAGPMAASCSDSRLKPEMSANAIEPSRWRQGVVGSCSAHQTVSRGTSGSNVAPRTLCV